MSYEGDRSTPLLVYWIIYQSDQSGEVGVYWKRDSLTPLRKKGQKPQLLKLELSGEGLKNLKPQQLGVAKWTYSFSTACLCMTEYDTVWPMDFNFESFSQFIFFLIYNNFSVKPPNKPVTTNSHRVRHGTLLYSAFINTSQNPTQLPVDFKE